AARMVAEVGTLARRADEAGKSLPTLSIDTDLRFASAADRADFTRDLSDAVTALAARYHDTTSPGGRWHRLVVAAHPHPGAPDPDGAPTSPTTPTAHEKGPTDDR
ncbi:MAG: ArsR family transcriptional regulator, partial [Actinomycetota bacterium]